MTPVPFKNLLNPVCSKNTLRFLAVLFLAAQLYGCREKPKKEPSKSEEISVLRQPAEYESQEAIWLIWPPEDHLQKYSNEKVTLEIIEALVEHEKIIVSASNDRIFQRAKDNIPKKYLENNSVELLKIPSEELWVRDMGPNFVELTNGKKAIVDFGFNAWGYTDSNNMDDYTIRMEKYDAQIAKLQNLPIIKSKLISEGGNREVNGKGILMLTETVEKGRNPQMSIPEMEAEFKRTLGVEKVIWLQEGLKEDDHTFKGPIQLENGELAYTAVTTNGHIDEFARFINDSTILLASVKPEDLTDPIAAENHKRMEANYNILKNATDQNGNPFRIIRMPLPKLIVEEMKPGDAVYDFISELSYEDSTVFPKKKPVNVIAAASYLNFLIADHVVIAQKYYREGMDKEIEARDQEIKELLEELFPNRKIVMLDALAINFGGGGIHCITMNEPLLTPNKE
ncbi:agmatine deiminase family protein [Galbibacter sp. BG1]|uniref:agmatine deiminase family protein n=1 Tax=Galbibacter sp. BG1 TaxID=1170699 RepID=UPI0015C0EC0D|nr:agmatine deiminase family protein [Galbibacter sp. BG1]QLE00716.1 agmatine deiminase family protein [Galbibacter sp. BG1]